MDTVRIPLGRSGLFAVIDREDAGNVTLHRWYPHRKGNNVYARTKLVQADGSSRWVRMHVFIMNPPPGIDIDHKDRDGLNNRRENLRFATTTQNLANSRQRERKAPYKGTFWDNHNAKWRAEVYVNGKRIRLGRFAHPEDAARAYDRAAREAFGEFAVCNFPE